MRTMISAALLAVFLGACGDHHTAPSAEPAAVTSNPAHHRYAVGLSSFPDDATAQAWVDKLKAVGVPAYIETVTQTGAPTVTELRGGPFDSSADASAAIAKIREAGIMAADEGAASAPTQAPVPASPVDAERQKQCEDVRTMAQLYGDELARGHDRKELLRQYGGTKDDIALINAVGQRMSDGATTVQQAMDAAYDDCMSAVSAPVLSGMVLEQSFDEKVHQRVRPNINWDGETSGLESVVSVRCSPTGTLLSAQIARSSGNADWDAAALQAVKRSDPMPLDTDGKTPAKFDVTMRPAG